MDRRQRGGKAAATTAKARAAPPAGSKAKKMKIAALVAKPEGASEQQRELENLLELARDRSTAARSRLVAILSELFFDGEKTLSERERWLMSEILRQLVHDVEKTVRKALAKRLSSESDIPTELLATLANDEIEVAHPILLHSEALRDLELIEIIQHHTMQHHLAIAMRQTLSTDVTDALVEASDSEV